MQRLLSGCYQTFSCIQNWGEGGDAPFWGLAIITRVIKLSRSFILIFHKKFAIDEFITDYPFNSEYIMHAIVSQRGVSGLYSNLKLDND